MSGARQLDPTRRSQKANALIEKFETRIVGQQQAKDALTSTVEAFQSGMYDKTRPIRSLLFLGPTGVGKTGAAEAFVEGLFGTPDHMMKVSCGEFQHSHEIAKLVGSPPGYLGHRETHPFFTNASLLGARSDKEGKEIMPFTVILWDEIEKANDTLWALLLGILDKGELTTGTNEKVDFRPTIHIMTSNVGVSEMNNDNAIGFDVKEATVDDEKLEAIAMSAARKKFMPEFLNRLDHIVMFKTLTPIELIEIRSQLLEKVQERIIMGSNVLFEMRVSDAGLEEILKKGYDPKYNARHLKRTIEQCIAEPLTRLVATGQIDDGDIVAADYLPDWDEWKFMAVGNHHVKSTAARFPSGLQS
jgi:ATP-dependent Clp protease ATP-binding subunit ClpB